MNSFKKFIIASLLLLFFGFSYVSCQKEIEGSGRIPEVPANDLEQTTATVQGYISRENGTAAAGALVKAGNSTAIADAKGYFRFNNIQLSKNNGYVSVTMAGYFNGSRSFVTAPGRVNDVRIQLLPKIASGSFDGTAGGTVSAANGLSIVFPANSIVVAGTTTAYTGQVKVYTTWINPTSNELTRTMPGDLRGITVGGVERGLETYGMMAAELEGSNGQVLAISGGKKASVGFPIPASLSALAPNSIPLWHFDEIAGRWKEEGSAVKTGNTYVAEVSHFSFWNCDAPFPLVTFTATIVNSANAPLAHASVRIKRVTSGGMGYGFTDSTGFVTGKIPANEQLILEVLDECYAPVYTQNVGPFATNASLGTIIAANSTVSIINLSGTVVTCANAPVANGYVELSVNNRIYRTNVTNGNYQLSITNCTGNTVLTITAIDNGANQQSATQTVNITSQTVVIPQLQACGISSLQTIDYTIDGTAFNLTSPADSISCFGQNGTTGIIYVSGLSIGNPAKKVIFQFFGTVANATIPLISARINDLDSISSPSPVVNITQWGAPGSFMEGNFNIQMRRPGNGSLHAVTCSFRVRRS